MNREYAFEAVKLRLEKPGHMLQSLAVEAVMRELAAYLHDDVDQWGIAGLVHDIDAERIDKSQKQQGMLAGDILGGLGFDEAIIYAVRSRNPMNKIARRRRIDKALFFVPPVCAFITECVKSEPGRDFTDIDGNMVLERIDEPDFAPGIPRDQITTCYELGISVDLIIKLSIKAIKEARLTIRL